MEGLDAPTTNEALEARLADLAADTTIAADARASAERDILEVYADWLEERGRDDVAHGLRGYRPQDFRPVSLAVVEPPDEPALTGRYGSFADVTLPLELFVIDELFPRPDPRPLEERKDWSLTKDNFEQLLSEQVISSSVDLAEAGVGQRNIEVRMRRLSEFEPASVAAQLSQQGVAADHMDRALRAVFSDPRLRTVERTWRSLRWLLDRISDPVRITVVSCSAQDLIADFEDSPSIARSGLFRMVNTHNHPGMRPSGAIVLGPELGFDAATSSLLRAAGEVARMKSLPLVTATELDPCAAPDWHARHAPLGRHVILARPSFVLRAAHPFEDAALEGSASYLVAARMASAFSLYWGGGGVLGSLPGVELTDPTARSRAIFAASRGVVELVQRGDDAQLVAGATASPSGNGSGSVDLHVIACRLGLQLQNLHFRRIAYRSRTGEDIAATATRIAEELERGLRARLAKASDVRVSLIDPRFEEPPTANGEFAGALDVGIALELPAATGTGVVRHTERVTVRLGF